MHADRDKSEQPFDRTSILSCHPKHQTHPISGRQVGLWSSCSCDAWEPCAAAERLVEAAQRPSPGLTAPDATTDTPDTLGGAQGRDGDPCECGHRRIEHIYAEGACRPGFACPSGCVEFASRDAVATRPSEVEQWRERFEDLSRGYLAMAERHSEHLHSAIQRAEAAERALAVERARVARVEALVDEWERGYNSPMVSSWSAVHAKDLRAALAEPEATEEGK